MVILTKIEISYQVHTYILTKFSTLIILLLRLPSLRLRRAKGGEIMAIIRWNPWNLPSLEDEWDIPALPGLSRLIGQGLNIYETEYVVVAEAALPGIPEDKIDISVDEGIVRVTASSEEKKEEKGKRRYFMSSMASSFNYSFRLPQGVAEKEPKAELDSGVLTLTFLKVKKLLLKRLQ